MKNISYVAGRRSPWCVCTTVAGQKKRKFFATETEAKNYLRALRSKTKTDGLNAMFFSPAERADYEQALSVATERGFNRILPFITSLLTHGIGIATGARQACENVKPVSIMDAYYQYYESKEKIGRRTTTLDEIRSRVRQFAEAHKEIPFSKLTQKHVEAWCVSGNKSPRTCKNRFSVIVSFLRWTKRRGYHSLPLDFDKSEFLPRILNKQKTVFSVEEVRNLLDVLQEEPSFRRYIPFYAIQLFCGLRRGEAERMHWNWIDIPNKTIHLPAEITKTGDEHVMREPFLPSTVFAWLAPFAPTVNKTAKIIHPSVGKRAEITKQFGHWEHNGMRHTFATMHVSLHGDPAKTAILLRHRNQGRLWQNYLARLVSEEDARQYFALKPQDALIKSLSITQKTKWQ